MPRAARGPYLWFDEARGAWSIIDGKRNKRTGFSKADRGKAEEALEAYLGTKHSVAASPNPLVADVLAFYGSEHAPTVADGGYIIGCRIGSLLGWWTEKNLDDVTKTNCQLYDEHRKAENISEAVEIATRKEIIAAQKSKRRPALERVKKQATEDAGGATAARGDLEVLRSAINFWHASDNGPLARVPVVWLPEKPERREAWMTRKQIAMLLWQSRKVVHNIEPDPNKRPRLVRHLSRFIILGFYGGSRSGVVFSAKYSLMDFENNSMKRKPHGARKSNKRAPPHAMPRRLKFWLLLWRRIDKGVSEFVVHLNGARVKKLRRSWDTARRRAELPEDVTPHTLRHSRATHLKKNRAVSDHDAAEFLGMTVETFNNTYGHHDPDWQRDAAEAR